MFIYHKEVSTSVKYLTEKLRFQKDVEPVEQIIVSLVDAIESRDSSTKTHCERSASMAEDFGKFLHLSSSQIRHLNWGGYLHDIGKIGIPDSILLKPGKLTSEEYEIMKQHTIIGDRICRQIQSLHGILPIIRHHHERWDGSGYPDGLVGWDIPYLAQIFQFVDIYDALTSKRPYKTAYSREEALEIIRLETLCGWRNPQLTEQFSKFIRSFSAR